MIGQFLLITWSHWLILKSVQINQSRQVETDTYDDIALVLLAYVVLVKSSNQGKCRINCVGPITDLNPVMALIR